MDYIYAKLDNNLVDINRIEYITLKKCDVKHSPLESLDIGDYYLETKIIDSDKIIYTDLSDLNKDDKVISAKLEQEILDRIAACDGLSINIKNEAARTDNMINQLNENVHSQFIALNKILVDSINTINGGIEEERKLREEADTFLQSNLDNESKERLKQDTILTDSLNEEIKNREIAVSDLETSLIKEITTVSNRLSNEIDRATLKENQIQNDLDTYKETTDSTLQAHNDRITTIEESNYVYSGTKEDFLNDFYSGSLLNNGNYISDNRNISVLTRNVNNQDEFLKNNYYLSAGEHTIIYEDGSILETFSVDADGLYNVYFNPDGDSAWGNKKVYIQSLNTDTNVMLLATPVIQTSTISFGTTKYTGNVVMKSSSYQTSGYDLGVVPSFIERVYCNDYGNDSMLRVGSASNYGSLTFTFNKEYKIDSVVLTCEQYDEKAYLMVTAGSQTFEPTIPATLSEVKIDFGGISASSLNITSVGKDQRSSISKIEINVITENEPIVDTNGYYLRGTLNNWGNPEDTLRMVEVDNSARYWGIYLTAGTEFKVVYKLDGNETWYPSENNYKINNNKYVDITFYKDTNDVVVTNATFSPYYIDKVSKGFRAVVHLDKVITYDINGITEYFTDEGGNRLTYNYKNIIDQNNETLTTKIGNEILDRQDAINDLNIKLTGLISSEKLDRETADDEIREELEDSVSALTDRIAAEEVRAAAEEANLDKEIKAEASERIQTDNTLSSNLSSEITRATNAESVLSTNITNLQATVSNNFTTLSNAIEQEEQARSETDNALSTRIDNLEGKTTRLYYGEGTLSSPTATEIQDFIDNLEVDPPYTAPYSGIAVVVKLTDENTYHIWHYYANLNAWKDDGVDLVNTFTNDFKGIIQGTTSVGYISAENGFGRVNGWNELNATLSSNYTALDNKINSSVSTLNSTISSLSTRLDSKIDTEISDRISAISSLSSAFTTSLNSEISRAQQAEDELEESITTETSNRTSAISSLSTTLTNSINSVNSTLSKAIEDEADRAKEVENTLSTNISSVSSNLDTFINETAPNTYIKGSGLANQQIVLGSGGRNIKTSGKGFEEEQVSSSQYYVPTSQAVHNYVDPLFNNKVDKITTSNVVYATTSTGSQTPIKYSTTNSPDTIVQRKTDGTIEAANPTGNYDVTNLNYVQSELSKKVSDITVSGNAEFVYSKNTNGNNTGILTSSNDGSDDASSKITKYSIGGSLLVNLSDNLSEENKQRQAVPKSYVDSIETTIGAEISTLSNSLSTINSNISTLSNNQQTLSLTLGDIQTTLNGALSTISSIQDTLSTMNVSYEDLGEI